MVPTCIKSTPITPGVPLTQLCAAVAFERISFTGVIALFVLYLNERYGLIPAQCTLGLGGFVAATYLTPVAGGWLADRGLGLQRACILGTLLMAIGGAGLMLDRRGALLPALALIALGQGLFKPNAQALVSHLHGPADPRRAAAFRTYYVALNVGFMIGPVLVDALRRLASWGASFSVVVLGATLALLAISRPATAGNPGNPCNPGNPGDPGDPGNPAPGEPWRAAPGEPGCAVPREPGRAAPCEPGCAAPCEPGCAAPCEPGRAAPRQPGRAAPRQPGRAAPAASTPAIARSTWQRIAGLCAIAALFCAVAGQVAGTLMFWIRDRVDRQLWGHELPPAYFAALPALLVVCLAPFLTRLTSLYPVLQAARAKLLLGMLALAGAYALLIIPASHTPPHGASVAWVVAALALICVAEILVMTTGMDVIARAVPTIRTGLLYGLWCAAAAAGHVGAGFLGSLWGQVAPAEFFALLAASALVGTVTIGARAQGAWLTQV